MVILTQFLMRLAFGLAVGMALTSSRLVSSGFFRNHLYVTLGLSTLAALVGYSAGFVWWPAAAAAALSYVGSVCWLYEQSRVGAILLWVIAGLALAGAWFGESTVAGADVLRVTVVTTSGLVLGVTTAAMLLGHWYLNAPGMQLAPLERLIAVAAGAVVLQAAVIGSGLWCEVTQTAGVATFTWWFVVLRWAFGIVGTLALLWMARQTLRIPNTQSATGILYVAVIAVFAGELAGLLLSARSMFPL